MDSFFHGLNIFLIVFGLFMLADSIRKYIKFKNALSFRYPEIKNDKYPMLSIIRPVKGVDPGYEENVRCGLDTNYKGEVEIIFVFEDENEPAYAVTKKVLDVHTFKPNESAQIVFAGAPTGRRTGKIHNMIEAMKVASGELIAFVDSDTRADKDTLNILVDKIMSDPKAGAVFAPVVVTEKCEKAGDMGYCIMLNALYSPAAAAVMEKTGGDMDYVMGQFMMFKKEAIDAIGGIESAEGQLVDDMFLGRRVMEEGYKNTTVTHWVPIIQYGMSYKEFLGTFVKWITFSRSGLSASTFKATLWVVGLFFWLGLIFGVFGLIMGWWAAGIINLLVTLFISWNMNDLHERVGGPKVQFKHCWVGFSIILLAPVIYGRIFFKKEVTWRGRTYKLNNKSTLQD